MDSQITPRKEDSIHQSVAFGGPNALCSFCDMKMWSQKSSRPVMKNQQPAKRKIKAVDRKSEKQKKRIRKTGVMENHRPAGSMEDRISQLPEAILQNHILSRLPQKDAVQTCILSKSWSHLGPTRPKIKFVESDFPVIFLGRRPSNEKFLSVVEKTLQRYQDQNLPIQEFILYLMGECVSESFSLFLNKWIPIVTKNMGLKTFHLMAHDFSMPSVVFQAEFLTELKLLHCKLELKNCIVKLRVLKCLSLQAVYIEEETFDKIMSSCPSIEHLVLGCCKGFSTIKVNKARNLKHFDCFINTEEDKSIEIDDAPSLETIHIQGGYYQIWYHHKNYFFPRLKSLNLSYVHLPTELLNNLSSDNCPCLEELKLYNCSGFTEFELSNCSIKRLIINVLNRPIKAAIDAANMLNFKFKSNCLPTFSFSTTSREWKSQIEVWRSHRSALSNWPLKLYEFLKSLSQSQISLEFSPHLTHKDTYDIGGSCEPAVAEHLCIGEYYPCSDLRVLLNCMFRICRPKYIGLSLNLDRPERRELAKSIWKTLVEKGETQFWQQDLEESSIQVSDKNTNEWRSGQVGALSKKKNIRFWLKWRDLS